MLDPHHLCGIFFLSCLLVAPGNSEVYSSAADMMEVFKLERELVGIMDNFAAKLQRKLDKINSYLEVNRTDKKLNSTKSVSKWSHFFGKVSFFENVSFFGEFSKHHLETLCKLQASNPAN